MRNSLRGKLILSHLAVIFVAMSVVTFLLLTLGQGYFVNALEDSLIAQAHLLSQALIPGASAMPPEDSIAPAINALQQQAVGNLSVQVENIEPGTEDEIPPELSASNLAYLNRVSVELSTAIETRFLVFDNQGTVLVDSLELDEGRNLGGETYVREALQGIQQSNTQLFSNEEWLFVTVPFWMEEQVVGAIHIGQPLRDVSAVLFDLRTRLLLVLIIALPLSVIIALVLARNIANPLRKLTIAAGRLGQGDYEYPLGTSGGDELGQLSSTFAAMRERLQAEERTRTQFVSDVSHELRTPLTAIKGLAETLRDGAVHDAEVRDNFLASVEGETDRLIRLVNDLLILSRADSKALSTNLEEMDLREVVRDTIDRYTPQASTREVSLIADFPDSILLVNADPDRIEQVMVNLLNNAIKHSPAGENVRVKGQRVDLSTGDGLAFGPLRGDGPSRLASAQWVIISVTDSGSGIAPADLPHVFDRFFRTDQSRSRDQGGSGLGLSIAKAIMEAHGGFIWLESPPQTKGISHGTKASFALPSL
jgi:signal transduction histidine kinase